MNLDIYTIVFFAIAVVIFVRLYGVLGQKSDSERPPLGPPPLPRADDGDAVNDNVVPLPRARDAVHRQTEDVVIDGTVSTEPETSLSAALRVIVAADRGFSLDRFLDGAKMAYEMIVTAYAAGDRKALKPLLAKDVLDSFGSVIDAREAKGEKVEFTFVGIDKAEILEAAVEGGISSLTVRFAAKVISVTRDTSGAVVDGDPTHLVDLIDVWTFAREIHSADPNWRLVGTRAVV